MTLFLVIGTLWTISVCRSMRERIQAKQTRVEARWTLLGGWTLSIETKKGREKWKKKIKCSGMKKRFIMEFPLNSLLLSISFHFVLMLLFMKVRHLIHCACLALPVPLIKILRCVYVSSWTFFFFFAAQGHTHKKSSETALLPLKEPGPKELSNCCAFDSMIILLYLTPSPAVFSA